MAYKRLGVNALSAYLYTQSAVAFLLLLLLLLLLLFYFYFYFLFLSINTSYFITFLQIDIVANWFSFRLTIYIISSFINNYSSHQQVEHFFIKQFVSLLALFSFSFLFFFSNFSPMCNIYIYIYIYMHTHTHEKLDTKL